MRTGIAHLPLHNGRAPKWLFQRMVRLSGSIAEFIANEYGAKEFLRRVSSPFFFQALGCAIGFDWHSSGLTTTTCGALKGYLQEKDIGIYVAGGKGSASYKVADEIGRSGLRDSIATELKWASRIIAKVDSAVVQDGYQLYHHCIFFDGEGGYAVVQQGLNSNNGYARRYHWFSGDVRARGFVDGPHAGIAGVPEDDVLDMTARENADARSCSLDLIRDNPIHIYRYFGGQATLPEFYGKNESRVLALGRCHNIRDIDLSKKDKEILMRAYELQPSSYEELVMIEGIGPKKIRALALVADLIYGAEVTWRDPVKYSFAHGGKDGIPFPVQREDYDFTIRTLEDALHACGAEKEERIRALKRLRSLCMGQVN